MTAMDCATIRDAIPDVAAGRAGDEERARVEAHADGCDDCRAELALARALFRARETAPLDLSRRVLMTLRRAGRSPRRPWWGISAAAVAALALGIGITSRTPEARLPASTDLAVETEDEGELWLADDGVLAGAPVFETLSDEALAELLEELTPTPSTGGQA